MSKKGKRPRAARRERERTLRKLVRERERLLALEPGGAPERPLEVPSPAVIEVRARAMGCAHCEGELELDEHAAEVRDGVLLRRVAVRCRRCRAPRELWYRVAPAGPN